MVDLVGNAMPIGGRLSDTVDSLKKRVEKEKHTSVGELRHGDGEGRLTWSSTTHGHATLAACGVKEGSKVLASPAVSTPASPSSRAREVRRYGLDGAGGAGDGGAGGDGAGGAGGGGDGGGGGGGASDMGVEDVGRDGL